MRPAWVEVDLDALRANLQSIRQVVGLECELMAVVKANAYGHGLVRVAQHFVACGADSLCVALLEEALELRESGVAAPILVMGAMVPDQASDYVTHGITASLCSEDGLKALSSACEAQGKSAAVHLKVNTGMNRIGVSPSAVSALGQAVRDDSHLVLGAVWSHLATADESDDSFAREQHRRLMAAVRELRSVGVDVPMVHLAASAGIARFGEMHLGGVRPGLALYGMDPCPGHNVFGIHYRPALSVKARIVALTDVDRGDGVSYGLTHEAAGPSRIATVPLGYADGYDRRFSNSGMVVVRRRVVPVVGRVCMDQFMVDVTGVPDVVIGDEVLVAGGPEPEMSVCALAKRLGTIPHEFVTGLSQRLPRVYRGASLDGGSP
ncbi:MAG TPA: alanine racemase [Armatimonadota bacterium]|nr:alanine racemase [Armatimonadota bacterium]